MKAIREMRKSQKGFTLIEIMIVVLIIGILLAIAIPNFMKARETAQTKACISNLHQIDTAHQQYAMDKGATDTGFDATECAKYIKGWPLTCPTASGAYTLPVTLVGVPTCAVAGHTL